MTRAKPFKKWRVAIAITDRLEERMAQERYHGSMTSYIEGILDRYAGGLLAGAGTDVEHAQFVGLEEKHDKRHRRAS